MSRKESIIAALVGLFIGSILGYFVSLDMIEKSKQHEMLIIENCILHQELINCEESK